MTDKEKILERIKKLFALGQSSNQHEAELAMAKASQLMQEHQISMTDVDLSEDGEITTDDVSLEDGRIAAKWLTGLAMAVATLYDGEAARMTGGIYRHGVTMRFYGTPTDIEAMKMTFTYLYGSWKSIVKHDLEQAKQNGAVPEGMTKPWKNSHGAGFSRALYHRARALAAERQANVKSATGRDLVVVKGQAVKDFVAGKIKGGSPSASRFRPDAYGTGRDRGNAIPLGGAINSNSTLMIGRRA